jgi:hypothetical protein
LWTPHAKSFSSLLLQQIRTCFFAPFCCSALHACKLTQPLLLAAAFLSQLLSFAIMVKFVVSILFESFCKNGLE